MILTLTGVVLLALGAICLYLANDDYTKDWMFCMGFGGDSIWGDSSLRMRNCCYINTRSTILSDSTIEYAKRNNRVAT